MNPAANIINDTTTTRTEPIRGTETTEQYIFAAGTYKLLAFAIGSIGVVGFCNNAVVIVLYYKFKRLRTPTNLLLVNISVSDLLVTVTGLNFTFVSCIKGGWVWSATTCVWDGFSNSLFGIVSIMTLSTLAYERYTRMVHARVVDFAWAWRAVAHIWLYSLAWTAAPLLGWNRYTLERHRLGCSLDWASRDPNHASFVLFFMLACFLVPVGAMVYCYGNILYTVRMLRSIQDLQTVQIVKILRYEKKVAVTFLLMISCFLACWTPYAVVSMLEVFGRRGAVSPTVAVVPSFFAKSSTAYNPLIYMFMSRKIRRCLLQLLCSRISWLQQHQRGGIKERGGGPLAPVVERRPIRPIVVSHDGGCGGGRGGGKDRPKKRVTFSSSSIVFIIASNDSHRHHQQQLEMSSENGRLAGAAATPEINVIQVRRLSGSF